MMFPLIAMCFIIICFSGMYASSLVRDAKNHTALPGPSGLPGPPPANGWRTVAVYREDRNFSDTKAEYSFSFVLKVNEKGQRKVEPSAVPSNQALHILNHHRQDLFYLAYITPWVEGTLTLEELAKALPKKLTIIPVQY